MTLETLETVLRWGKYILFSVSALLSFLGTWIYTFTKDGEDARKRLTKPGRWAFGVALGCLVLGMIIGGGEDYVSGENTLIAEEKAARDKKELKDKLDQITEQYKTLLEGQKGVKESIAMLLQIRRGEVDPKDLARTSEGLETLNEVVRNPGVRELVENEPELKSVFGSLASLMGGKRKAIRRIWMNYPGTEIRERDITVMGTFNLHWFGRRPLDETGPAVINAIRGMEADLLAIQEISGDEPFAYLEEHLPEFNGILVEGLSSMNQAVFARKGVVSVLRHEVIEGPFARRPLVIESRIGGSPVTFVAVHLRAGVGDGDRVSRRTKEIESIASWVAKQPEDMAIVLAGTFHADVDGRELEPLRARGAVFATADLPEGVGTFVIERYAHRKSSHVVLLGNAKNHYIPKSSHIYLLSDLLPEMTEEEIKNTISDNNPLSAVFVMGESWEDKVSKVSFLWSKNSKTYHEKNCFVTTRISAANRSEGSTPPAGLRKHLCIP